MPRPAGGPCGRGQRETEIALFTDRRYRDAFNSTKAAVVVTRPGLVLDRPPNCPLLILVKEPRQALAIDGHVPLGRAIEAADQREVDPTGIVAVTEGCGLAGPAVPLGGDALADVGLMADVLTPPDAAACDVPGG